MRDQVLLHNAYDSHTHFWATGQVAEGLRLNDLKSAADVENLKIQQHHRRGNWIVGFGWNEHQWSTVDGLVEKPHRKILDRLSASEPIFFSRTDGHASWLNTKAIEVLQADGFDFSADPIGGRIERDEQGRPTGILYDQAHIAVLSKLPDFSESAHLIFLERSQKIFNQSGFTHVRDLSMNEFFWNLLRQMEDQKKLTVCIESFVTVESLQDLSRCLQEVKRLKNDRSRQLRIKGVKIFIDGSLGSKTAAISENYTGTNQNGLLIWSHEEMKQLILTAWKAQEEVAIHTIGDRAVEAALKAAREVSASGVSGRLHLEHVQLLSAEHIKLMKPLHVTCYMQPCHWLSDAVWIRQAISEKLVSSLFQWELLRKNKIPFFFGSDSPIEKPSLADNLRAINESAAWGIPKLNADPMLFHRHPDANWCPSQTHLEGSTVRQVIFNGESLF